MQPRSSKPLTVGLLDIDDTIIQIRKDLAKGKSKEEVIRYNLPLLSALKESGIVDLYIFTNMDGKTLGQELQGELSPTRKEVIEFLQEQGFIIHAVVTPADIAMGSEPGKAYKDIYLEQYKKLERGEIQFEGTQIKDKDFDAVALDFNNKKRAAGDQQLPILKQKIEGKIKYEGEYNIKGPLYEFFVKNMPQNIGHIVYVDDEVGPRTTVHQVQQHVLDSKSAPLLTVVSVYDAVDIDDFKKEYDKAHPEEFKKAQQDLAAKKAYEGARQKAFEEAKKAEPATYPFLVANQDSSKQRYQATIADGMKKGNNSQKKSVQQQVEVDYLVKKIDGLLAHYKELKRTTHVKDIKKLIQAINDIAKDKNLSPDERLKKIVSTVENNFQKELSKIAKQETSAIATLNKKGTTYHYPRLLGVILKDCYAMNEVKDLGLQPRLAIAETIEPGKGATYDEYKPREVVTPASVKIDSETSRKSSSESQTKTKTKFSEGDEKKLRGKDAYTIAAAAVGIDVKARKKLTGKGEPSSRSSASSDTASTTTSSEKLTDAKAAAVAKESGEGASKPVSTKIDLPPPPPPLRSTATQQQGVDQVAKAPPPRPKGPLPNYPKTHTAQQTTKRVKPLSAKKEEFLKDKSDQTYMLAASDLDKIIPHYAKKYGVKIYKNGTSPYSKAIIDEKRKEFDDIKALFLNPATRLAAYYIYNYDKSPPGSPIAHKFPEALSSKLYEHLKANNFLKTNGHVKADVDHAALNVAIKELLEKENQVNLFDPTIEAHIKYLDEKKADVSVSKEEAIQEILKIQASLKEGEVVGYVFTNEHNTDKEHFEAVIITPDRIIRPVVWAKDYSDPNDWRDSHNLLKTLYDIPGATHTKITDAFVPGLKSPIIPQIGGIECGTMSMLYLKELLKNNAALLQDSLEITYYDNDNKEVKFFLPPPDVLRYSQYSLFNNIIAAIVNPTEGDIRQVHHKSKKAGDVVYDVRSLKSFLEMAIIKAKENGNHELAEKNQKILDNLAEFQARWMTRYQEISEIRDKMSANGGELHRYLEYKTSRMQSLSKQAEATIELPAKAEMPPKAEIASQATKQPDASPSASETKPKKRERPKAKIPLTAAEEARRVITPKDSVKTPGRNTLLERPKPPRSDVAKDAKSSIEPSKTEPVPSALIYKVMHSHREVADRFEQAFQNPKIPEENKEDLKGQHKVFEAKRDAFYAKPSHTREEVEKRLEGLQIVLKELNKWIKKVEERPKRPKVPSDLKAILIETESANRQKLIDLKDEVDKKFAAALATNSISRDDKKLLGEQQKKFDEGLDRFLGKERSIESLATAVDVVQKRLAELDADIKQMSRPLPATPGQKKTVEDITSVPKTEKIAEETQKATPGGTTDTFTKPIVDIKTESKLSQLEQPSVSSEPAPVIPGSIPSPAPLSAADNKGPPPPPPPPPPFNAGANKGPPPPPPPPRRPAAASMAQSQDKPETILDQIKKGMGLKHVETGTNAEPTSSVPTSATAATGESPTDTAVTDKSANAAAIAAASVQINIRKKVKEELPEVDEFEESEEERKRNIERVKEQVRAEKAKEEAEAKEKAEAKAKLVAAKVEVDAKPEATKVEAVVKPEAAKAPDTKTQEDSKAKAEAEKAVAAKARAAKVEAAKAEVAKAMKESPGGVPPPPPHLMKGAPPPPPPPGMGKGNTGDILSALNGKKKEGLLEALMQARASKENKAAEAAEKLDRKLGHGLAAMKPEQAAPGSIRAAIDHRGADTGERSDYDENFRRVNSKDGPTAYELLGIQPGASDDDVAKAYDGKKADLEGELKVARQNLKDADGKPDKEKENLQSKIDDITKKQELVAAAYGVTKTGDFREKYNADAWIDVPISIKPGG